MVRLKYSHDCISRNTDYALVLMQLLFSCMGLFFDETLSARSCIRFRIERYTRLMSEDLRPSTNDFLQQNLGPPQVIAEPYDGSTATGR